MKHQDEVEGKMWRILPALHLVLIACSSAQLRLMGSSRLVRCSIFRSSWASCSRHISCYLVRFSFTRFSLFPSLSVLVFPSTLPICPFPFTQTLTLPISFP